MKYAFLLIFLPTVVRDIYNFLYSRTIRKGFELLESFFYFKDVKVLYQSDNIKENIFYLIGAEDDIEIYQKNKEKQGIFTVINICFLYITLFIFLNFLFEGINSEILFGNDNLFFGLCIFSFIFLFIYSSDLRNKNEKIILNSLNELLKEYDKNFYLKKISIFTFKKQIKEFVTKYGKSCENCNGI